MSDSLAQTTIPPLNAILAANQKQVAALKKEDEIASYEVSGITIIVSLEEKSEWEPYVNITASAELGKIHVIINRLHPYYDTLESQDAVHECIRQYIYDAISEYKVSRQVAQVRPENVRRVKDGLLRARDAELTNAAEAVQSGTPQTVVTQ